MNKRFSSDAGDELRFRALAAALASAGLSSWGFVSGRRFHAACGGLPAATRAKFGADEARGAVAASLAYGEGPAEPPDWAAGLEGPDLALARFARADWYGELAARLRGAASAARAAIRAEGLEPGPARAWRYLANSGLPEKPLALAAGLGSLGRNGLVLLGAGGPPEARPGPAAASPPLGPGAVLGLLLLPFDPADAGGADEPPPREDLVAGGRCGACRACIEACPTAAIGPEGAFRREACLQHWTAREGEPPAALLAVWENRLYGCDACLEACPRFRLEAGAATERGRLGPSLPAGLFLDRDDDEVRHKLRGSALGLGWMSLEGFRRSARLARARKEAGPGDASEQVFPRI
ncbi:MAG: hypothetical protein JNG85_17190 [Spirochaetaceae bacterium]|nr:hypothetical protein [Spirochaetaceae bacterium]